MADKKLTKEEAHAMYDDMERAMKKMLAQRGAQNQVAEQAQASAKPQAASQAATQVVGKAAYNPKPQAADARAPQKVQGVARPIRRTRQAIDGQAMALIVVACLGCAKIALSALAATGISQVNEAHAVVAKVSQQGPKWSKEEAKILTSLDLRRVELDDRANRLEKREQDFVQQERELAVRLTELRDLSERLRLEREKSDKQRNTQLDQLANVYGSMNPPEAAHLLEQLDIQVSLSLIERMPEKRMAQILALMTPSRALELTNLLSKRK